MSEEFNEAAREVAIALDDCRNAKRIVENMERNLKDARAALNRAEVELTNRRDAFFRQFPELAPAQVTTAVVEASPESQPAVVEEAKPVPVMTPQGPVVFREMDDSPFGDGS